jgi:hypothetical protein
MQKVLDFLEKNVQWLVLGLGAAVFLLMVWWYVIQPPVTVQASGETLMPGDMDQKTVQGPVSNFKQAIARPAEVDMTPPDYIREFHTRANQSAGEAYVMLPKLTPRVFPLPDVLGPREGGDTPVIDKKVPQLPVLAAATPAGGNNGMSVIMLPDPKSKARQQRLGAQAAAQPVDMIEVDKAWVTQSFEIDIEKLQENFKKVFADNDQLPPSVYETQVVYVELIREEKLPNGSWGNRASIKPLAIHEVPEFPSNLRDQQKALEFDTWAREHASLITNPPFYQVAEGKGDPWVEPGMEVSAVSAPAPAPSAASAPRQPRYPAPGGYGGYGRGPYGGYGGGGYGGYGGGGYGGYGRGAPGGRRPPSRAMQDQGRPYSPPGYGGYPGGYGGGYPGGYGGYGGGRGGYPGGYGGYGRMPYGMPYGMPPGQQQQQAVMAEGAFNVTQVNQDIRVWAHDDTVESGKTYRYAIHYYLRNPLFNTFGIAEKKELSEQYALKSDLSKWSDQVKITPKVNFFLAAVGKDNAKFDVFTWQKGNWRKKSIQRSPGDLIPDTTWTLVDTRKEGNENYILLVNQGGQIQRRDFSTDRKSSLYQQLNSEVENAKTASLDR